MFDVNVRFLDGSSENIVVARNSYITDLRAEIVKRRGLTKFHEVKLFQGTEELKDDGYLEVQMPIQARARVRLNLVGSNVAVKDALQPWEHWSGNRFWGVVIDNVRPVSAVEQDEFVKVEVQAGIILSFDSILGAIRQWVRGGIRFAQSSVPCNVEAALSVVEGMQKLDSKQLLALLDAAARVPSYFAIRIGRALGRLFDEWCEVVPALIIRLESPHNLGDSVLAVTALSTMFASSPSENWLLQDGEAVRIHFCVSELIRETLEDYGWDRKLISDLFSAAIPLLGATGTSENMAWLAIAEVAWGLDNVQELFLAGEQWRRLRQAAPAAFNPDEPTGMDAHATQTSDIGCRSSTSDPEQATHACEVSQDARWQKEHVIGAEARSVGLNPPPSSSNIATTSDAQSTPTAHSTAGFTSSFGVDTMKKQSSAASVPSIDQRPAADQATQPGYGEVTDVEEDYTALLMEVASRSRSEVGPLPLSSEGVVLSQLTRMGGSKRLQDHFDKSEHLASVHERLQASGCLMRPDFTMARTCIPLTEDMLNEIEIDLGDLRPEHIISLTSDVPLLNCKGKRRPELSAPRAHLHGEAATSSADIVATEDDPPLQNGLAQDEVVDSDNGSENIEVELVDCCSLRTDSSVGFAP